MYLKKIMAATFAATALAGQAQEKTFSIIPEPVEITVTGQGEYLIQRNTVTVSYTHLTLPTNSLV